MCVSFFCLTHTVVRYALRFRSFLLHPSRKRTEKGTRGQITKRRGEIFALFARPSYQQEKKKQKLIVFFFVFFPSTFLNSYSVCASAWLRAHICVLKMASFSNQTQREKEEEKRERERSERTGRRRRSTRPYTTHRHTLKKGELALALFSLSLFRLLHLFTNKR